MNNFHQLSLEQQFNLRRFAVEIKSTNKEQAQEFLVELYRQMMIKDNLYRQLIKSDWHIGLDQLSI